MKDMKDMGNTINAKKINEKEIEKALYKIGRDIPVNMVLKEKLKNEFSTIADTRKKRRPVSRKIPYIAAAVAICLTLGWLVSGILPEEKLVTHVAASSLKISNHISFISIDIATGNVLGVSEYNGLIYVPISGKGLFVYDKSGFRQLSDEGNDPGKDIQWARISPDGNKLLFSTGESIGIYDIQSKNVDYVLRPEDDFTYYIQPSWLPDGDSILYTKQVIEAKETHGFNIKESGIYRLNLKTLLAEKLAEGEYASFVKGKNAIVFERDGKVIYKSIAGGSQTGGIHDGEKIVDEGRFPSVSFCGSYITYVKYEKKVDKLAEKVSVNENIQNIWIADTENFDERKRITSNYPHYFIDKNEWLESLEPSNIEQVLAINGAYSYYEPVWSSNSGSVYALKNSNVENREGMKIVKIEFSHDDSGKEDTVKRFLQALIARDDDYAKSLMKSLPEILTISNPRPVGYSILSTGSKSGKDYVEAEVYLSYTANPYFMIDKSLYYMSNNNTHNSSGNGYINGYIIDRIEPEETIEVFEKQGTVSIKENDDEKALFKKEDIPEEFLPAVPHRFSCLAYNPGTGMLVFAIQTIEDYTGNNMENNTENSTGNSTENNMENDAGNKSSKPAVILLSYSVKDNSFKLIDTIKSSGGGVACSSLTMDSGGKYAAIDLFLERGKEPRNFTLVYDLNTLEKTDLSELVSVSTASSASPPALPTSPTSPSLFPPTPPSLSPPVSPSAFTGSLHSVFWDENRLVFSIMLDGQTMNYIFNPEKNTVEAY